VDRVVAVLASLHLQLCLALELSFNLAKTKLKRDKKWPRQFQLSPQIRVRPKSKAIAGKRNTSWQSHKKSTKRPKMKSKRKKKKLSGWWKKKKMQSCIVCQKWRLSSGCHQNIQAKTQYGSKKGSEEKNSKLTKLKTTWSGSTNLSWWNSRRF